MSKIIKLAAPALILPDRGIRRAMMEQPCQQQQAHFGFGFVGGGGPSGGWDTSALNYVFTDAGYTATTTSTATGKTLVKGVSALKRSSGKLYFEILWTNFQVTGDDGIGFCDSNMPTANSIGIGAGSSGGGYYPIAGNTSAVLANGSQVYSNGPTPTSGSVQGVYVDIGALKCWFVVGGNVVAGGNPATNSGGFTFATTTSLLVPAMSTYNGIGESAKLNTVGPFVNTVATGFSAWG